MKRIRVKPGKAQSIMGFFVGIVFCLIGIFMVIPMFGMFGIFWTILAGIIMAANGVNAFSSRGVTSHEILIDDDMLDVREAGSAADQGERPVDTGRLAEELKNSIESRLQAAEELYRSGTITRVEYEAKRKEILGEL